MLSIYYVFDSRTCPLLEKYVEGEPEPAVGHRVVLTKLSFLILLVESKNQDDSLRTSEIVTLHLI